MNCKKAQKWMSREFDDALSDRRIERLNAHLAVCSHCRAIREQWLQLRARCRAQVPPPAISPEEVWMTVRHALQSESGIARQEARSFPAAWFVWRPAWAGATFALLLAVMMATLIWRLRPPSGGGQPPTGTVVEFVETGLPGAAPMVYQDIETGCTVIWVVEANGEENKHAGT